MKNSLKVWWNSFKAQIIQEVPRELDYCQFECRRVRCMMEETGSCDLLPRQSQMLIMPSPSVAAVSAATAAIEAAHAFPAPAQVA